MFTEAFPVGSANFAATSFDPNFSFVWQRRLSFSPKIISFTNWAHSSQVCIALSNSFSMFAMVVFMRATVLGSAFGVLPRSCPHSNAFGTHAVRTGPGSSKQHLHNKRQKINWKHALLIMAALQDDDFYEPGSSRASFTPSQNQEEVIVQINSYFCCSFAVFFVCLAWGDWHFRDEVS